MKSPLYNQLYTYVLEQITSGQLKLGDRVPSEKDLADQFGVSRITSKRALEQLFHDKIIERIQGKGSFVIESKNIPPEPDLTRRLIGVILPDFSDAYGLKLIQAIEDYCASLNYFVIVKRTHDQRIQEETAILDLVQLKVSGLLVFPVHGEFYNTELVRLVLSGFPVVLIDRYLRGIPAHCVYTDNIKASQALTDYMFDRGHTNIAFVSPPAENTSAIEDRIKGFTAAFISRGYVVNPQHLMTGLHSTLAGAFHSDAIDIDKKLLGMFIETHPDVTAFVACEYNVALLLLRVLTDLHKRVPEDYTIVCFDSPDTPLGKPLFTHIRQDETLMGCTAVDLLMAQFGGSQPTTHKKIAFALIEGQTVST